jgi:hypothetical protein
MKHTFMTLIQNAADIICMMILVYVLYWLVQITCIVISLRTAFGNQTTLPSREYSWVSIIHWGLTAAKHVDINHHLLWVCSDEHCKFQLRDSVNYKQLISYQYFNPYRSTFFPPLLMFRLLNVFIELLHPEIDLDHPNASGSAPRLLSSVMSRRVVW